MKRIALEALVHEGDTLGLGHYAKQLIEGLVNTDNDFDFHFFDHLSRNKADRLKKLWLPEGPTISTDIRWFPKPMMQFLEETLGMKIQNRWLKKAKVDLVHGVRGILPPLDKGIKKIVTVHDIGFMIEPSWYEDNPFKRFEQSVRECDKVIVDSPYTQDVLQDKLKVPSEKITCIPLAANKAFTYLDNLDNAEHTRVSFRLPKKFMLFVGGLRPVKNLNNIVRAFHQFKKERSTDIKLVLTGKKVYGNDPVLQFITQNKMENDVIFTDYVPLKDLVNLYNLADSFVFTTLYEGFGFPVLEAMACKTPVLASNNSCLPITCGDAALFVDPYNVNDIAEGMHKITHDNTLRDNLIQKGLVQHSRFSWQQCVNDHLKCYEEVLNS